LRSILFLGVLMGMRHALEADHLAAVASLATRTGSLRAALLQGAAWGLGHTLTLLLFGGVCLLLGAAVPESWARGLESVVGVMLIFLGGQVLWRIRRRRIHLHVHRHGDGETHVHAHGHQADEAHDASRHEHSHAEGFPVRALAVGIVHGLAGSAALLLLTVLAVGSFWQGLTYIALFGAGSMVGMAVLGSVIAVPLQASARLLGRFHVGLEAVVGLATIVIGARMLYDLGRFGTPG
jgi:ABC-type nickel/cobalt efflux system permease component RcnA